MRLLRKVNGVILPGSDLDSGDAGYYRVLKKILKYSKQQFQEGEKFPILGICRGAQRILLAVSGKDITYPGDASNLTLPLKFTSDVKKSQLFGNAPDGLISILGKKPLAFYYQDRIIPTKSFHNNTKLKEVFLSTSTNIDRNGTAFVSTYEGRSPYDFPLRLNSNK